MTRPPRPKYPSDSKNYHDLRKPGFVHTVRLPEELLGSYMQLKRAMGAKASNADVIRFLFETAEAAIAAVVQAAEPVIVPESVDTHVGGSSNIEVMEEDPGAESPAELTDEEPVEEERIVWDFTVEDVDDILCQDSQIPNVPADLSDQVHADASYGFWPKHKVFDFFLKFPVMCPSEHCMRKFLPPKVGEFQQLWSVQMKCLVGHSYSFLTGELEKDHGVPDVTGKLYHSALCSGMTHTCLESLCQEVGLHVPRRTNFFDFQSGKRRNTGWIQAALDLWEEQKKKLQHDLLQAGKPLVLYVDCRFDSSRSGFHGTLPVINRDDDKVIEMVTLTRKQMGSSWKIETMALEEALKSLEEISLKIEEVIHDDNKQVDCILAQHAIMSSKDLWHKCKNIMGKFKDDLQEKRRSPTDSAVEGATTIAAVAVFSVQQLKDFCKDNGLPTLGNKLQLVQRVSVFLKLPEAGADTEIQRTRPLRYPELAQHDLAYKLKSWIYTCAKNAVIRGDTDPKVLTLDVQNAADHWAGNHTTCRTLPGTRKCVTDNWTTEHDCKYTEGGETHKAVKDFLKKHITESKMKFYVRARENFMSEMFHSVINKYATKRIHFDSSHTARLACSAMDWNENIRREVRAVYNRVANDTAVRRRAKTNKVLVPRTNVWKQNVARRVFG